MVIQSPDSLRLIDVFTESDANTIATTILGVVQQLGSAEVRVFGARAMNCATQAIAIARSALVTSDSGILVTPYLTELEIEHERRSAMCFVIEPRPQDMLPKFANRASFLAPLARS